MEKEFLKLYKEGKKDSEIARILDKSETFINKIRWKLKLPPNGRVVISDKDFMILYDVNLTIGELAKKTNMSESATRRRLIKLNLGISKKEINLKTTDELLEDGFIKYYNETSNDVELSIKMGISLGKIKLTRKRLNLPIKQLNLDNFSKKVKDGLTDSELAIYFNISKSYSTRTRIYLKLKRNLPKLKEFIPLSDIEFQVMLGGILGDSTLYRKYNRGNTTGSFNHCMDQLEYAKYKQNLLKNLTNPVKIIDKYDERFNKPKYQQAYCYIKANPALNEIHDNFYKNGNKEVPKELFEKIDGLGLSIWFMDDGSNGGSGYVLCTHSFNNDSVKIIRDTLLTKFNITTTKRKDNSLYIKSESVKKFNELINPFIIPSMQYKIINKKD